MEATKNLTNNGDNNNQNEIVDKTMKVIITFMYALLNHALLGKIKWY